MPSLSRGADGAWMAEGWKVGCPQRSSSKLKVVFEILCCIFRVNEEKLRTGIKLFENGHWEARKAKTCFWGWCFAGMGPGQVPCCVLTRSSRRLACCPHLSFCHGSGRQTTADRVKRWLPVLRSKTIISSCFPTTCQKWFIGTGMGWTRGRHCWSQSSFLICAALSPNSPGEPCSAGDGWSCWTCVWLFCACQKGDDHWSVPWAGVCQLSLG